MRKLLFFILLLFIFLKYDCSANAYDRGINTSSTNIERFNKELKQDLLCLMLAYPNNIVDITTESSGRVYVIMKSGNEILYDDRRIKSPGEKLNNPDLQDMMEQRYPLGSEFKLMDKEMDPGRIRVYSLLREVYGTSRGCVEKNLKNIGIGYRSFQFNSNNKAAISLGKTFEELTQIASTKKNIYEYLFPCGGTYNYRVISGTGRLSPHSFGIAIDLKSNPKDYWKWASRQEGEKRIVSYPSEIVETFEKNNFIWGGKWGHFDILHFEYRPEIILKAKYFGSKRSSGMEWYEGAETNDERVIALVNKINERLK